VDLGREMRATGRRAVIVDRGGEGRVGAIESPKGCGSLVRRRAAKVAAFAAQEQAPRDRNCQPPADRPWGTICRHLTAALP
jgi:hypothetical protein